MPDGLSELTARLRFHGDEDGPTIVDTMAEAADAIDRLRALLREYGRHAEGCDAVLNDGIAAFAEMRGIPRSECATYRCRCGWDEAEKGLEGKDAK